MDASDQPAETPRERPRALELADRWEALGYNSAETRLTPELQVEWAMMNRLERLNSDEGLNRELMDITVADPFEGPFVWWGDGRPSLNYHLSVPENPNPPLRTDPRELKMLATAVVCAEKTHEIFKQLELEPVPEAAEGDFTWLEAVARNGAKVDELVKQNFVTDDWEPGFQYVEACVQRARNRIAPYSS